MLPALAVTRPARHERGVGAADGVGGAADLERVDRLQRLELAPDLGRRVLDGQPHERRAHRRAGDPLARRARSPRSRSQLDLDAGARRARARDRELGGGEILDGDPQRAEHRQRRGAAAPRAARRSATSPSSATDVLRARSRPPTSARRYSPASFSTDSRESTKSSDAASVATSSSRATGDARADRVDVRARREPAALDHRRRRVGRGHDHVGALERLARARGDRERRPAGEALARATPRGARALAAVGEKIAHALERRARAAATRRCAARLHARADHREACARPRAPAARVASAVTAAVRIDVTAQPLRIAVGRPVSPSKSATMPWWASRPSRGLPGKMQTALRL